MGVGKHGGIDAIVFQNFELELKKNLEKGVFKVNKDFVGDRTQRLVNAICNYLKNRDYSVDTKQDNEETHISYSLNLHK